MARICRILKQSERQSLTKVLSDIVADWANVWLPAETVLDVAAIGNTAYMERHRSVEKFVTFAACSGDSWCGICDAQDIAHRLSWLLLGGEIARLSLNESPGEMQRSLAIDALRELAHRVVAGGNVSLATVPVEFSQDKAFPEEIRKPWGGAVSVRVKVSGFDIELMLSNRILENIVPLERQAAPTPDIDIKQALQSLSGKTVQAKLQMRGAKLSIGSISNLSPGDVLLLDHNVNHPFQLKFDSESECFLGYLGKRNGRYAFQINEFATSISE